MCRRMSYVSQHVGNVNQYQLLAKHEASSMLKQKLSPLMFAFAWLAIGWLIFFVLTWWALTTVPALISIALATLLLVTFRKLEMYNAPNCYPTTISLCLYGINFMRSINDPDSTTFSFRRQKSLVSYSQNLWFSWDSVAQVRYLDSVVTVLPDIFAFPTGGGRVYLGPALDLILDPETMSKDEIWVYHSSAIPMWANWPRASISSDKNKPLLALRIDLSALTPESEKERFISCIKKYVPEERLDFSLLSAAGSNGDYTKFWLDDFEAASRRKQITELTKGRQLAKGRYKVLRTIASGGQATVYLAQPEQDGDASSVSPVVLKEFILPIDAGPDVTKRALQHVQEEAALLKTLDHPHIVRFIESFLDDHRAYLVLEYVEGTTLRKMIKEHGPLPESMVIELALKMCEILAYLHSQSPPVIHRDFTPDNLMLAKPNQLKLIDFNVAQRLESTSTRTVVGKHCYIPPEQFRGKAIPQSDLYALGGTLFYLLTGSDPAPLSCSDPSETRTGVNPKLAAIVARLTAVEATKRYPDVTSLRGDLQGLLTFDAALSPNKSGH